MINWRDGYAYQGDSKYTKSTRIRKVQYKFLHTEYQKNFLTQIGVWDNPNCSLRNKEQGKPLHLSWSFPRIASFWHGFDRKANFSPHYSRTSHKRSNCRVRFNAYKSHQQIYFFCLKRQIDLEQSKEPITPDKIDSQHGGQCRKCSSQKANCFECNILESLLF